MGRLRVNMQVDQEVRIPLNYSEYLTAAVYDILRQADPDYARFLHDEGYRQEGSKKRFKMFTHSNLRASARAIEDGYLVIKPGLVDWFISSPSDQFLATATTGLLVTNAVRVAENSFKVREVERRDTPEFHAREQFVCLTPVVAKVMREHEGRLQPHYLRPDEPEEFSRALRTNLVNKYRTFYGTDPQNDEFSVEFDRGYLERQRGTKLITYKAVKIVGAFAPFIAKGAPELIQLGYEAGFGNNNAIGFGMVR